MKTQTRVSKEKIKIQDLFFKLGIDPYPDNHYVPEFDLKVKTPYGYKPIVTLFTTEKQKTVTTYFTNGKRLETSSHHLLKTLDDSWKKVQELSPGDKVITETGETTIKKQVYKEKEKVLYDMSVQDVHCYYSNGVLSHNSWTMVAAAAHAVKLGYNVIYYTLELGEDYVGKRFDCYFTGYGIDEVNRHREKVQEIVENLPGKLIVKEYAPKAATVGTIKAHIQKCADIGFKADMVIIDYVDYLRAPSKKFTERKDEIDDVFVGVKGLARELKIPILTPSQVNRMGSKDSVIEGDKAAGSYDKIMVADICISLSRMKEDKVNGTGRIHIMKNRYGIDGMTYNAQVDTNNGHIYIADDLHIEEMPRPAPTTIPGVDSVDRKLLANKFFELQQRKETEV
jgi:hypothetical protein